MLLLLLGSSIQGSSPLGSAPGGEESIEARKERQLIAALRYACAPISNIPKLTIDEAAKQLYDRIIVVGTALARGYSNSWQQQSSAFIDALPELVSQWNTSLSYGRFWVKSNGGADEGLLYEHILNKSKELGSVHGFYQAVIDKLKEIEAAKQASKQAAIDKLKETEAEQARKKAEIDKRKTVEAAQKKLDAARKASENPLSSSSSEGKGNISKQQPSSGSQSVIEPKTRSSNNDESKVPKKSAHAFQREKKPRSFFERYVTKNILLGAFATLAIGAIVWKIMYERSKKSGAPVNSK